MACNLTGLFRRCFYTGLVGAEKPDKRRAGFSSDWMADDKDDFTIYECEVDYNPVKRGPARQQYRGTNVFAPEEAPMLDNEKEEAKDSREVEVVEPREMPPPPAWMIEEPENSSALLQLLAGENGKLKQENRDNSHLFSIN
jgi:hypothetical protein